MSTTESLPRPVVANGQIVVASPDLAPCECGGVTEVIGARQYWIARCPKCGTASDSKMSARAAINEWNRCAGQS